MDGINNNIWGPAFWTTCHYITISYPFMPNKEDKEHVKSFFELLQHLLPCPWCRIHYKQNLEINPLTDDILSIKLKLILWVIDMHNYVNKQLGKDEVMIEDALISLFTPPYTKEGFGKYNKHGKQDYNINKLRETVETMIFVDNDGYNYNLKEIIAKKEQEIKDFNKADADRIYAESNKKELGEKEKDRQKKQKENFDKYIRSSIDKIGKNIPQKKEMPKIEIKKQEILDMNKIIEKMHNLIEQQNNDEMKYLVYTGFESICLMF